MPEPERIGIRELRQHASRCVAMAEHGKRVAVTDRGRAGGLISSGPTPTATFRRMVAAGRVRPARGNLTETLVTVEPLEARPGEKTLSEVLQEMRDEERY